MSNKTLRSYPDPCPKCDEITYLVNTDGACPGNGRYSAKAGVGVYWNHDHNENVKEPLQGLPATNNNAELAAVAKALGQAKRMGIRCLEIRTDSKFAVDALKLWIDGWKKRGWTRFNGEELKNRAVLEEVDAAAAQIEHVDYRYVPRQENKEADELARQGVKLCNFNYGYGNGYNDNHGHNGNYY